MFTKGTNAKNVCGHNCKCTRYPVSCSNYLIAGNSDVFDTFQPDCQNLTSQIFKAIQRLVKDSDHLSKYFPSNV